MEALQEYAERRDFERTPEPAPRGRARSRSGRSGQPLRYVVHEHDARSLHYDFRLELDGVLVSWAVPKGPSLDPKQRRLAVRTEDHPLEYAEFEGVLPPGEYGAGSVAVWDAGSWEPEGDAQKGLRAGKLKLTLHGKKLAGRYHLARTRTSGKTGKRSQETWLLIKGRDAAARSEDGSNGATPIVQRLPRSVLSGRTVEEIGVASQSPSQAQGSRSRRAKHRESSAARPPRPDVNQLAGTRRASLPAAPSPQLATLVSRPPRGEDFVHEAKLDGYRLLAELRSGHVRLWTRGEKDWSQRLPTLVEYLESLGLGDALLDGELVVLDSAGLSQFQLLQNVLGEPDQGELLYVVFDLLHLDGRDLKAVPLLQRKETLQRLLASANADPRRVRYGDHVLGSGEEFFRQACKAGLEGVVSKRADAPYRSGRGPTWLKSKCLRRQEAVIGGYTDPSGSRSGLGALLLGLHDERGQLRYVGKVGTGFTQRSLEQLQRRLKGLSRQSPPFVDPPRGAARRGVHWVAPQLLAEVEFSEVTQGGKLRHPSFKGLREDKPPQKIALEVARPMQLPIALTHPDRILFPEQGITKQALAEYMLRVSDRMLPYLEGRLLSLVRCPSGRAKPCFFQKHAKQGLPDPICIYGQDANEEGFIHVRDAAGLVALVQLGVLEIHPWGARIDYLERPDQLIFDLDPDSELGWEAIVEAALDVRDELRKAGLESFVKTTGGQGLHVVAPITRHSDWEEAKAFTKAIADKLSAQHPDRYVASMSKRKRQGRIFIDYLRNARGATAVAPYSTRARPGAPVAMPVAWQELSRDLRASFDVFRVPERLAAPQRDPWHGFFELRQRIAARAKRRLGLA